jgi:Starch-binding associating with outer membrane
MKNIAKVLLTTAVLAGSSCNFVDYKLNVDPNNPSEVSINLLLPGAQAMYGYILGGDMGRYTSIWMQQHAGVDRQHLAIDVYQIKESDVDNAWNSMYNTVFSDLSLLLGKATATNSPHYTAVGKTMTAMALASIVDLYNDVPFSEAIQGQANLTPKYDAAATLYTKIQSLLDEAYTDASAATSVLKPGTDDLIYAGNMTKWKEAIKSLKARYALRLSKLDAAAYTNALTHLATGISANANDAAVVFGTASGEGNPWAQFQASRAGDLAMSATFIDMLNTLSDPRRAVFATQVGGVYKGAKPGEPVPASSVSSLGSAYAATSSPIPMITYAETKFIEAEAAFKTNDKVRAATAHNNAVKASLAKFNLTDAAYVTANASETDVTITLEKIMQQKYIALYTQIEVFNDWRRTGLPALLPARGQAAIARRFPYAQNERLYNNANYKTGVTQFDRVFWDKQ